MDHIVLSEDQLKALVDTNALVAVHDESGKVRGYISVVINEVDLDKAKRAMASKERRYTTDEVLAKLHELGSP